MRIEGGLEVRNVMIESNADIASEVSCNACMERLTQKTWDISKLIFGKNYESQLQNAVGCESF